MRFWSLLLCVGALFAQGPEAVVGPWRGTLQVGGNKLRLVFHFTREGDQLRGTFDSVDQAARGLPLSEVTFVDGVLRAKSAIGMSIEGKLDGDTINATFTQGIQIPLTLTRGEFAATKRPQQPKPPFPYATEEVSIDSSAAGVKLACTLALPKSDAPVSALVLSTGSGPHDRDETLFEHKPFLLLADHLARNGIATLRCDDRGVASSSGSYAGATSRDFADDIESAFTYLLGRKEVDAKRVGILGHSEGGIIGPMIAARNTKVAYVVMLGGPGVSGDKLLNYQVAFTMREAGATEETMKPLLEARQRLYDSAKSNLDATALKAALEKDVDAALGGPGNVQARNQMITQFSTPWMREFLGYDPVPALKKLKIPVYALLGEKDFQVPPSLNLEALQSALGANKAAKVEVIAGANHLFQSAKTGALNEYGEIEETMMPAVLDKITAWITTQNKPR